MRVAKQVIPKKLRRKLKDLFIRWRRRRAINYAKHRYNLHRQDYYGHQVAKLTSDDSQLVSIVIPCYNTPPRYFEPLLASIFNQGYYNWELVLVDASDNKKAGDYLRQRSKADARIKYLKVDNHGIAANTNQGLAAATGRYIAFADHDDTLDPDALAELMEMFIRNPALSLVYSDEDKLSEDGERFFEPHLETSITSIT
jgi:glycosyltransferase involved in cell wall biosynthesis